MVRLHMDGDRPSIEGIWTGMLEGHYVLKNAKLWEREDASVSVGETYVPARNVLFMQKVAR